MTDALELFRDITHLQYFDETSIILFLNKIDIFEKKLQFVPLTRAFPEYQGRFPHESNDNIIYLTSIIENYLSGWG